jgi:hypothetical protein
MMTKLVIMGIIASCALMLVLSQEVTAKTAEQEQIDRMTKSLEQTDRDLRQMIDTAKACYNLSPDYSANYSVNKTMASQKAAQDPDVRNCLKKNFGWSDDEIDMRYGLKPIPKLQMNGLS